MLKMTKYTGTKTIKACPMPLGEAEKALWRNIETSAVENRELTPGYLVEDEEGYRSWSPKEVFDKAYRVSETHLDRMNIEKDEVEARYLAGRKFSFTQQFRNLPETKRKLLTCQLDKMEGYLYILSRRIELESQPQPEYEQPDK